MVRRPDDRIPVEPLSEARWARIEHSLEERLGEEAGDFGEPASITPRWRSPRVLWIAGVAAVAASVFLSRASFRSVTPSAASHIETGEAASHVMVGGASILIAPRTEALVSGDEDRGVLVVLEKGRVDCEVAPRHEHPAFLVQAGEVRVRVVGTRFTVRREAGDVSVDVERGVVEVEAHGETERVTAGMHWPAEAAPIGREQNATVASEVGGASIGTAPTLLPPAHTVATRKAPPPSMSKDSSLPATDAAQAAAPAQIPTSASGALAPDAQQRYEAAARMEARDPVAALAVYLRLARDGSDAWSANALYAAGRLQADRGASGEARALLQEYLTRFPHGLNAPDAHDLLARVLHATP